MVEHMSYTRSSGKTAVQEHYFFLLRTPLVQVLVAKRMSHATKTEAIRILGTLLYAMGSHATC